MAEYQHTPPPWQIFEGNGDAKGASWISVTTINQDCSRRIATVESGEYWSAEYQANVRLISLAPKLLEMLDRVISHQSDGWIDEHPDLYKEAAMLIVETIQPG